MATRVDWEIPAMAALLLAQALAFSRHIGVLCFCDILPSCLGPVAHGERLTATSLLGKGEKDRLETEAVERDGGEDARHSVRRADWRRRSRPLKGRYVHRAARQ
ncbi:hypothetical protein AAFF_G00100820 [Aldrovandia affinis]|uniref:Uncharacterized protein n=1 Tax=Aldrovandia affinis TaxID=143900 RepID=A0AAD7WB80_9TELE|nr:hypothetical protein AAFF_G00100820 [Aldrovandia affinis]